MLNCPRELVNKMFSYIYQWNTFGDFPITLLTCGSMSGDGWIIGPGPPNAPQTTTTTNIPSPPPSHRPTHSRSSPRVVPLTGPNHNNCSNDVMIGGAMARPWEYLRLEERRLRRAWRRGNWSDSNRRWFFEAIGGHRWRLSAAVRQSLTLPHDRPITSR